MIKNGKSINADVMRKLADTIKEQIPGTGFALIVFDLASETKVGNYISNVHEEFMIKALEQQLLALKNKNTFHTPNP